MSLYYYNILNMLYTYFSFEIYFSATCKPYVDIYIHELLLLLSQAYYFIVIICSQ